MVIYVDDFKMAGRLSKLKEAWSLLRTGEGAIIMDDPTDVDHYLGCKHEVTRVDSVVSIKYNMEKFLDQCLEAYVDLVGTNQHLKTVSTPIRERR